MALVLGQVQAQMDTLDFAKPQKLSEKVNSGAEESLPILSPDGATLYFTRTFHPQNTGGKWAGSDIWQSKIEGGQYTSASKSASLNTRANDAVVGTARNGKRLYLLNKAGDKKGGVLPGISRTDFDNASGKWGDAVAVPIPGLEVEGNFYSAYVGPNEDYILWTLPANGIDTINNLYVSLSKDQGESWTAPSELAGLNTSLDEISPSYDDARGLVFWSSNGRDGFGDYDIYYARRMDDSWMKWSDPVNAGSSINSAKFDAYFFASPDGTAWFSSNRGDSLSNLYLSSMLIKKHDALEEVDDDTEVADAQNPLPDGKPSTPVAPLVEKDPVLIIDTKDGSRSDRTLTDLSLEELLDKDTHIRFVYFPYDKYNITAKYIEVLDDVGKILDSYPQLTVLIEGHTDNVGSQAYNIILSENRAQSTKEYLMIHGVEESRVKTKAHGKMAPYATNDTDEGRALNRRVELYFSQAK